MEETKRFRAYGHGRWSRFTTLAAEQPEVADPNITASGVWDAGSDGLVVAARGHKGGTWAHWQLALAYAQYLSPAFHAWCNGVVRDTMERFGVPSHRSSDLTHNLEQQFGRLDRTLDTLDRHAADTMFLVGSTQDLVTGRRREFTERSRAQICIVVSDPPFDGQCPSCSAVPVLTDEGKPVEGAQYDHAFHRGLNRPEHGWLICKPCHHELTYGRYLARFGRITEFRYFQDYMREAPRVERANRPIATRRSLAPPSDET